MQIIDISKDIAKCEIYPGDPPVKMKRTSDISRGDLYNLTEITTGLHNGTHYDAPLHFIKDGHSAEKADLSVFIGECWVVETPAGAVTGEFVNEHFPKGAKRVLMKGGGKSYLLESAAEDSYSRLIAPSVKNEIRGALTDTARERSLRVFGENLKNAAEAYQKAVIKLPWHASTASIARKIIKKFNLPDIVIDCAVPQEDYAPQRRHLVCCT